MFLTDPAVTTITNGNIIIMETTQVIVLIIFSQLLINTPIKESIPLIPMFFSPVV